MKRTTSKPALAPTSRSGPQRRRERLTAARLPIDTFALARDLIGKLLIRTVDGTTLAGRIVETEAYVSGDPASHAFRGLTARNRAMFGPPFHAYVYFIYGANWCLNVTSETEGTGAAVLLRACEPVEGLETMRALRGRAGVRDRDLARGPGNLCKAFAIGPAFDGRDLTAGAELWLADDGARPEIGATARIGITRAADAPWRFYARASPSVSGPRALSP